MAEAQIGKLAQSVVSLALPFVVAAFVAAILLLAIGENPLSIFGLMAEESFGSARRIASTLSAATPLLFTATATAICFRSGVFNFGVEGAVVGAIWLWFPGWLLARWQVDEVVSTLMLNFIAAAVTGYLIYGPMLSAASGNNVTPPIHEAAELGRLMPPSTLHAGFPIGLLLLLLYGLWCRYTAAGFESALVGLDRRFSRAMGISVGER